MAARATETTVLFTATFAEWLAEQTQQVRNQVGAAVNALRIMGVALKEPTAKHIDGKIFELRCAGGNNAARVFYAFDTERNAVLLLGGSKADKKLFTKGLAQAHDELRKHEHALAKTKSSDIVAKKKPNDRRKT